MASSKEYLDFVIEQLSGLDEMSSRARRNCRRRNRIIPLWLVEMFFSASHYFFAKIGKCPKPVRA